MSYQTEYRPQAPAPSAPREQDMGSLMIGIFAGFIGGLIGLAITYFWGSKETRSDRLLGAGIGLVAAIILVVVMRSQAG